MRYQPTLAGLSQEGECTACPLAETAKTVCVVGVGPQPAEIMLIGEAPGTTEDTEGAPFVGAAGELLNELLGEAGLKRSDVYITNSVRCRPPQNRMPTKAEALACRDTHSIREIAEVRPKIIIALGGAAGGALTGLTTVGENRGRMLPLLPAYGNTQAQVLITYHPAATIHQGSTSQKASDTRAAIVADITMAKRCLAPPEPMASQKIVLDTDSKERVATALRWLAGCTELGADCEWEVLENDGMWPWSKRNGRSPKLVSLAIAGERDGKFVSLATRIDTPLFKSIITLLERTPSIYHNAAADLIWLHQYVRPPLSGCTLLLASFLNVGPSLGLKVLAPIYTDIQVGWGASVRGEASDQLLGREPVTAHEWHELLHYNAIDALATLKLKTALEAKGAENPVMPLYRRMLGVISALVEASMNGTPLDYDGLKVIQDEVAREEVNAKGEIADELDMPELRSTAAKVGIKVALQLQRKHRIKLPTTKGGQPSIASKALAAHQDIPAVQHIMAYGKARKLMGTYIRPWRYLLEQQETRRLHSVYKLWLTRTGRSSAEADIGGQIQQTPREQRVRSLFRAEPGWKIMSADLSQIEMRIAAWLAPDPTMLALFESDVDVHKVTAGWISAIRAGVSLHQYQDEMDVWMKQVTADERQAAKSAGFGYLFGMREKHFIEYALETYGVVFDMHEAELARTGFFSLYPGLAAWHDAAWRWVSLGYVDTPMGRRRYLPEGEDDLERQRKALNSPVQGTASDLALLSLEGIQGYIGATGLEGDIQLIGFIHDDVLLHVREEHIDEILSIVRDRMEHPDLTDLPIDLTVPLKVDIAVGDTWAG